jgi:CRISPR/Cas system-associated protein endoribonuclease Cas2
MVSDNKKGGSPFPISYYNPTKKGGSPLPISYYNPTKSRSIARVNNVNQHGSGSVGLPSSASVKQFANMNYLKGGNSVNFPLIGDNHPTYNKIGGSPLPISYYNPTKSRSIARVNNVNQHGSGSVGLPSSANVKQFANMNYLKGGNSVNFPLIGDNHPTYNKIGGTQQKQQLSSIKNNLKEINTDLKKIETLVESDIPNYINKNDSITITFGDVAEHRSLTKRYGTMLKNGLTYQELLKAKQELKKLGCNAEIIHLNELLQNLNYDEIYEKIKKKDSKFKLSVEEIKKDIENAEDAYIFYAPNIVDCLLGQNKQNQMYKQHDILETDKRGLKPGHFSTQSIRKAIKQNDMEDLLVNYGARHNLVYNQDDEQPNWMDNLYTGNQDLVDTTTKRQDLSRLLHGRVVSFDKIPLTKKIRETLPKLFGSKAKNLKAEGNFYYDISKTGITWHGDTERVIVIAVRLGKPNILQYQWKYRKIEIGDLFKKTLNSGDLYAMSEKAVGTDWKRSIIPTLVHSAGHYKL